MTAEAIVTDATAIKSPPSVGRALIPLGMAGGTAPIETGRAFGAFDEELYVHLWFKLSSNWNGPGDGIQQLFQVERFNEPGVPGALVVFGIAGALELQWHNFGDDAWVQLPNLDASAAEIVRNEWHEIELVLVMNTGTNFDGEIHIWVDGIKTHVSTVRRFLSADPHHFHKLNWKPIYGSAGSCDREQSIDFDHIYVSGKTLAPVVGFNAILKALDQTEVAALDGVLVTEAQQQAPAAPSELEVT